MKAALMLAVNPNSERQKEDFYATDPYAIVKMSEMFKKIGVSNQVWECACGNGCMSKPLQDLGYEVLSTDLVDRGFGEVEDFLTSDRRWGGDIITNPPFKLAEEFIKKSMKILNHGQKALFLLKIQFLETIKRAQLFKKCGLKHVIVNSDRICCAMNGDFDMYFKKRNGRYVGGTQLYAWFVFEKGFVGKSTIDFV